MRDSASTCRVVAEIIAKDQNFRYHGNKGNKGRFTCPGSLFQGSCPDVHLVMHAISEVCIFSHFGAISIYRPKMLGSRAPRHTEISNHFLQDSCGDFPWQHAHQIWCSYLLPLQSYWHLTYNFLESRDHDHAPFTLFWHSVVGRHEKTSFELWTAIIGPWSKSEKCFKAPLKMHYARVEWGKIGDTLVEFGPQRK